MSSRISQRELESYLWGAAVVLRGLIDAGDYKQYIFPLVFLKRISDVYDRNTPQRWPSMRTTSWPTCPRITASRSLGAATGTTSGR